MTLQALILRHLSPVQAVDGFQKNQGCKSFVEIAFSDLRRKGFLRSRSKPIRRCGVCGHWERQRTALWNRRVNLPGSRFTGTKNRVRLRMFAGVSTGFTDAIAGRLLMAQPVSRRLFVTNSELQLRAFSSYEFAVQKIRNN